jgi:hypothetical protein
MTYAGQPFGNMRRAGIPQVVRMKISGHKTSSMGHRYKVLDAEDLSVAKTLVENRLKASGTVTQIVTSARKPAKQGDTFNLEKSAGRAVTSSRFRWSTRLI